MRIREVGPDEALAVETVRVAAWKVAYRGLLPDGFLDGVEVDADRRAARMADVRTLLAEQDGVPVGMATTGPCRDDDLPGVPELYALYVVPTAWRAGVGSALLAEAGPVQVLWVLRDNARARAFYARHGFAPDGAEKELELGAPVVEVRMARP